MSGPSGLLARTAFAVGRPDDARLWLARGVGAPSEADWSDLDPEGRSFAYLQCYRLTDWNIGFGEQPDGTRGIDQFIGEPQMINCGHGSALTRNFAGGLLTSGTPRVVTDPDPKNLRAVRAHEKAGFRKGRMVDTPDGRSLLMVRDA